MNNEVIKQKDKLRSVVQDFMKALAFRVRAIILITKHESFRVSDYFARVVLFQHYFAKNLKAFQAVVQAKQKEKLDSRAASLEAAKIMKAAKDKKEEAQESAKKQRRSMPVVSLLSQSSQADEQFDFEAEADSEVVAAAEAAVAVRLVLFIIFVYLLFFLQLC